MLFQRSRTLSDRSKNELPNGQNSTLKLSQMGSIFIEIFDAKVLNEIYSSSCQNLTLATYFNLHYT